MCKVRRTMTICYCFKLLNFYYYSDHIFLAYIIEDEVDALLYIILIVSGHT